MRTLEGYKTKQRAEIEELLKESGGRHFTADELCLSLTQKGTVIGRTTVYRCLERLCGEGRLRKYVSESGKSACYQYIPEGGGCSEHFHLLCTDCGRLIHIDCDHMKVLSEHIMSEHGFKVNNLKTVLYGVCEECRKK